MADKNAFLLRHMPVAAAFIAAISATASCVSSFYSYRSQSAGERAAVFAAQFETAASANYDLDEYLLDEVGILQKVSTLDRILSEIPTVIKNMQSLSPIAKIGFMGNFKGALQDSIQSEAVLSQDGENEVRDLIKIQLLFPARLVRPLLAVMGQTRDVANFIHQHGILVADMEDSLSQNDRPRLQSDASKLVKCEQQANALSVQVAHARHQLVAPFADLTSHLGIERLEPGVSD